LFLSEHADTVFELVFLVNVHGLLRDRALLGRLNDILYLALRSQVLRSVVHSVVVEGCLGLGGRGLGLSLGLRGLG
jgi:hypothetical protein